jgi:hypothetical protein
MTSNESEVADEMNSPEGGRPSDESDESQVQRLQSEVEQLRSQLAETTERLRQTERNLRWIAQQQASETGRSVCPSCNSGGSLGVERTAAGKKKVKCTKCGERLV